VKSLALALALALALFAPLASAHLAPLPGPGDSWQNATDLGFTPGHSYGALPPQGGIHYYTVQLVKGEHAVFRLVAAPGSFTDGFPPYLVLASPRTSASGYQPPLPAPPGNESMDVRAGARPGAPGLDPWLPAPYHTLVEARVDAPADERWYLTVYSPDHGGAYAVFADPVGASASYLWNVPTERIEAYRWEGMGSAEAWGVPVAAGLAAAAGVLLQWKRGREGTGAVTPLAALAATLLAASTGSLAEAATRFGATFFTWCLVALGLLVAAGAIALAVAPWRHARWLALALGLASLATASGFLLAPISLLLGAALPAERRANRDS
jgi:hypothetical protein